MGEVAYDEVKVLLKNLQEHGVLRRRQDAWASCGIVLGVTFAYSPELYKDCVRLEPAFLWFDPQNPDKGIYQSRNCAVWGLVIDELCKSFDYKQKSVQPGKGSRHFKELDAESDEAKKAIALFFKMRADLQAELDLGETRMPVLPRRFSLSGPTSSPLSLARLLRQQEDMPTLSAVELSLAEDKPRKAQWLLELRERGGKGSPQKLVERIAERRHVSPSVVEEALQRQREFHLRLAQQQEVAAAQRDALTQAALRRLSGQVQEESQRAAARERAAEERDQALRAQLARHEARLQELLQMSEQMQEQLREQQQMHQQTQRQLADLAVQERQRELAHRKQTREAQTSLREAETRLAVQISGLAGQMDDLEAQQIQLQSEQERAEGRAEEQTRLQQAALQQQLAELQQQRAELAVQQTKLRQEAQREAAVAEAERQKEAEERAAMRAQLRQRDAELKLSIEECSKSIKECNQEVKDLTELVAEHNTAEEAARASASASASASAAPSRHAGAADAAARAASRRSCARPSSRPVSAPQITPARRQTDTPARTLGRIEGSPAESSSQLVAATPMRTPNRYNYANYSRGSGIERKVHVPQHLRLASLGTRTPGPLDFKPQTPSPPADAPPPPQQRAASSPALPRPALAPAPAQRAGASARSQVKGGEHHVARLRRGRASRLGAAAAEASPRIARGGVPMRA